MCKLIKVSAVFRTRQPTLKVLLAGCVADRWNVQLQSKIVAPGGLVSKGISDAMKHLKWKIFFNENSKLRKHMGNRRIIGLIKVRKDLDRKRTFRKKISLISKEGRAILDQIKMYLPLKITT